MCTFTTGRRGFTYGSVSLRFSKLEVWAGPTLRMFLCHRCNRRLYSSVFVSAHGLGVFMTL